MIFSILRERIIEFDIKIFHRPLSKRVVTQRRGETFSKENKQSGDRKDEALEGENFIREREREREREVQASKKTLLTFIILSFSICSHFSRMNTVSSISRYIINRNTDEKMLCGSTYCECTCICVRVNVVCVHGYKNKKKKCPTSDLYSRET